MEERLKEKEADAVNPDHLPERHSSEESDGPFSSRDLTSDDIDELFAQQESSSQYL